MPIDQLITRHQQTLDDALAAIRTRSYYSAYPESPSPRIYGETAAADGKQAYERLLNADFPVDTPGADGRVATERSPYGPELGVAYPRVPANEAAMDALLGAAQAAIPGWREAGPAGRAAVCLEI